jgi:uncharacterized membrane protein YbhN (UPF0104 family)
MQSKVSRRLVAFGIGGTFLCFSFRYIYVNFQWAQIYQLMRQLHLYRFLIGGGLSIIAYWLLRALRWRLMLHRLNIKATVSDLYLCTSIALSMAILTPLQSGEAFKVELLKKMSTVDRSPGYTSFALERYLDLFAVMLLAIISLSARLTGASSRLYIFYLLAASIFLFAVLFIACKWDFGGKAREYQGHIRACVSDPRMLLSVVALTLLCWVTVACGWQICLHSLSIDINLRDALSLTSIMTIINILSFIPGAVGVSEAGIAEFLTRLGKAPAAAQAGALVLRFYSFLIILIGIFHLLYWKVLRLRRRVPHLDM